MKAYRLSVKLKLLLILAAVLIAVASLFYTRQLTRQLKEREKAVVQLWADAIAFQLRPQPQNPYASWLQEFERRLRTERVEGGWQDTLLQALAWMQRMQENEEGNFIIDKIIVPDPFGIPAIITDQRDSSIITYRNVPLDTSWSREKQEAVLRRLIAKWDRTHDPIPVEVYGLAQRIHYGDSELVAHLRLFPYVQLFFVALFILVGYMGFSYVRRNEQSSLWAGMAKEAAHQLGTPLSSMMGWIELLKDGELEEAQRREIVQEMERDMRRLQRVAARFSEIGSLPRLTPQPLAPVVERVASYIKRRMPQLGKRVELQVEVAPKLVAPINAELLEWVIENLLKNALDAIDGPEGSIHVRGYAQQGCVILDISDTGRGIERKDWKHIFRPGFSTKKRGWGLGLSLARRIVETYHKGSLMLVSSRPGKGSTFRIILYPNAGGWGWRMYRRTALGRKKPTTHWSNPPPDRSIAPGP